MGSRLRLANHTAKRRTRDTDMRMSVFGLHSLWKSSWNTVMTKTSSFRSENGAKICCQRPLQTWVRRALEVSEQRLHLREHHGEEQELLLMRRPRSPKILATPCSTRYLTQNLFKARPGRTTTSAQDILTMKPEDLLEQMEECCFPLASEYTQKRLHCLRILFLRT